jgi:hypothetical protein
MSINAFVEFPVWYTEWVSLLKHEKLRTKLKTDSSYFEHRGWSAGITRERKKKRRGVHLTVMSVYRTLIHQVFHRKVRTYRCLLERQYHEHLPQLWCKPVVRPMAGYNANVNLALQSYLSEGKVRRIVKKIIVYGMCSFTAVFKGAHYWFIFWTRSIRSTNSHHISFR